jgi:hypothetical protein
VIDIIVVALGIFVLGTVIGIVVVVSYGVRREERSLSLSSQKTIEERFNELSKSMRDSARLVEQLSAELDARAATAKRLKEEADAAEALAKVNKEQADAIRRMMDVELAVAARRNRKEAIALGILFFLLGGGVTVLVTLLIHPLH